MERTPELLRSIAKLTPEQIQSTADAMEADDDSLVEIIETQTGAVSYRDVRRYLTFCGIGNNYYRIAAPKTRPMNREELEKIHRVGMEFLAPGGSITKWQLGGLPEEGMDAPTTAIIQQDWYGKKDWKIEKLKAHTVFDLSVYKYRRRPGQPMEPPSVGVWETQPVNIEVKASKQEQLLAVECLLLDRNPCCRKLLWCGLVPGAVQPVRLRYAGLRKKPILRTARAVHFSRS